MIITNPKVLYKRRCPCKAIIRASVGVKDVPEVRPIMLMIDKEVESIKTLQHKLRTLFHIPSFSKVLNLQLDSGEILDDIKLVEKFDKVMIEITKARDPQTMHHLF